MELKYKAKIKRTMRGNACRNIRLLSLFILNSSFLILLTSCARMGAPDGGWYDEKPPRVLGASPAENSTNVKTKKVAIYFDEYIKIESASEKVMISPPQLEQPEIKVRGRNIYVNLLDTLKPNTTYSIDFSDAIVDNNEGNPLGNYTYTFSTGDVIDTLEVSGYVIAAKDLEPVKGILVGLYAEGDTLMRRVARTNSLGRFVIRGVAPGTYTIGAVKDADGDYRFTQRSEMMAFSHEKIVPTSKADIRQDTLWQDKNHIKDITLTGYTHFLPDNIVLRAFEHQPTDRYFLKVDRTDERCFTLYFTAPVQPELSPNAAKAKQQDGKSNVPVTLKGINFNAKDAFIVEPSANADTITYWLRDAALVNQDTLTVEMTTYLTDTLGVQRLTTDTLDILAKKPYAERLKAERKEKDEWKKALEKRLRKAEPGEKIDTVMPRKPLEVKYDVPTRMTPNGSITIAFPAPLSRFDSTAVHLYVEQDSLWYRAPFTITPVKKRRCEVYTDWIEGANYSFEVDSLAFTDIYGNANGKRKIGIEVGKIEEYSSLFVNVSGVPAPLPSGDGVGVQKVFVELLDGSDKVLMTAPVEDGTAEFYYIAPGTYYLRATVDSNGNGVWDTGDYFKDRQPEEVFYYGESVECKAKWDITKTWNLTSKPIYRQKPGIITKQKADKEKTIRQRNAERASSKGIELPEYLR